MKKNEKTMKTYGSFGRYVVRFYKHGIYFTILHARAAFYQVEEPEHRNIKPHTNGWPILSCS
jgi:hypothetical protein